MATMIPFCLSIPISLQRAVANFRDPIRPCLAAARFDDLSLPAAGEIVFRIALAGSIIMERRVRVVLAPS